MENFWNGFNKQAQVMFKRNALGGIEPTDPEELQRAQAVELSTLPRTMQGANCGNCDFFRSHDSAGFCTNPEIQIDVTERMICVQWTSSLVIPAAVVEDQAAVDPAETEEQANQVGQELGLEEGAAPPPPEGNSQGQPAPAEGEAAPPKEEKPKEKKKPEKKKEEKPAGNNININVGKK